jgi:hypothetical protein
MAAKKSETPRTPAGKRRKTPNAEVVLPEDATIEANAEEHTSGGQVETVVVEQTGAEAVPDAVPSEQAPEPASPPQSDAPAPDGNQPPNAETDPSAAPAANPGSDDTAETGQQVRMEEGSPPAPEEPKATKTGRRKKAAKAGVAAAQASTSAEKFSALDAAAKVLGEAGGALTCKEMIEVMAARGYWTSPKGKTPASTLYSAILRENQTKGTQSRFQKTDRGKFSLRPTA